MSNKPARFGGPKKTAAQQRAEAAAKAAAAGINPKARRSDEEPPEGEEPPQTNGETAESVGDKVPHQAEAPDAEPAHEGIVTTGAEIQALDDDPFRYVPPPEGLTAFDCLGHIQRGIIRVVRGIDREMGKIQRDATLALGEYFHAAQVSKSYKAGKFKSVEAFVEDVSKQVGYPIDRKRYYKIVAAHVVYTAIGDQVDGTLSDRVIEKLHPVAKEDKQRCREVFAEMKRAGKITPAGVAAALRLLTAGDNNELVAGEKPKPPALQAAERLDAARKAGRLADLQLLREVAQESPGKAQEYVKEVRSYLEEAEKEFLQQA